jgi:hypothetical protein
MESYLGVAKAEGITEEEIGAVQSIVMAVSAGKINAQLNEVRSGTKAGLSAVPPSSPNT